MITHKAEGKLRLFFFISLLLLFAQFFVYAYVTKFYPAVVMPMFGYGSFDMQNIPTTVPLVVIHFNNSDTLTYSHHELLGGMPKPIRATSTHWILENERPELTQDSLFIKWLKQKTYMLSGRSDIAWIDFYKVEKRYGFADSISIVETKRTKVQHITL